MFRHSKLGSLLFASITSFLFSAVHPATARADGIFRPSTFKITFYEIGIRNSSTGALLPVFKESNGIEYDLSSPNVTFNPPSNFSLVPGSYDQLYVLTSNVLKISGNDGTCFITGGASQTQNDGDWAVVQTGNAGAGEATITENGFNSGGVYDLGPVTPAVSAAVNGTATSTLAQYLVSSSNPVPGGGGTVNRFLFIGGLANSINLDASTTTKTVGITIDTSQSGRITGNCAVYRFSLTKFALTIKDN